ncbi:unnamed protein product [Caenorhabditis bovis]|uniref:Uncharacterized protein n=1 Tax=Caenorhabditis bovis TaxID=2654633 RepID=A0A8S1F4T5_9PELO|nr:unnamed protein product [Caenorhabditis bovis]
MILVKSNVVRKPKKKVAPKPWHKRFFFAYSLIIILLIFGIDAWIMAPGPDDLEKYGVEFTVMLIITLSIILGLIGAQKRIHFLIWPLTLMQCASILLFSLILLQATYESTKEKFKYAHFETTQSLLLTATKFAFKIMIIWFPVGILFHYTRITWKIKKDVKNIKPFKMTWKKLVKTPIKSIIGPFSISDDEPEDTLYFRTANETFSFAKTPIFNRIFKRMTPPKSVHKFQINPKFSNNGGFKPYA